MKDSRNFVVYIQINEENRSDNLYEAIIIDK